MLQPNIYNAAVTRFIWSGKRPWISLIKLKAFHTEGEIYLPNLRGYNVASLSRHLIEWIHGISYYSNYEQESALVVIWELTLFLHTAYKIITFAISGKALYC